MLSEDCCSHICLSVCLSVCSPKSACCSFSPLGNLADRATYFACVNFFLFFIFFNDHSENNYLRIYWTDFRNLFTKLKHYGCRWLILTSFSDISRDICIICFYFNGTFVSFSWCAVKNHCDYETAVEISWNASYKCEYGNKMYCALCGSLW